MTIWNSKVTLPNGVIVHYRYPADRYIVSEHKVFPPYFRHGDLLESDVLLDVGSHIGLVTAQASDLCKQIISVEAEEENYELLCINCGDIDNVVTVKGFASCSSDVGMAELHLGDNDLSSHSAFIGGRFRSRTQKVERIYINDLLDEYAPDFVKLDCEGSEWYLYQDILDHPNAPQVISLEAHLGKQAWVNAYPVLIQDLLDEGYTVIAPEDLKKNWNVMVHASKRL